jgi:hypothetical protein
VTSTYKARATTFAKCHHLGLVELGPTNAAAASGTMIAVGATAPSTTRASANTAGVERSDAGQVAAFRF